MYIPFVSFFTFFSFRAFAFSGIFTCIYHVYTHHVFFSSLIYPQGTLTVVGENETLVRASMDAECNVSLDAHAPLGMPGLVGKLTVHQGKNDLIQGTALLHGEEINGG